MERRHLSRRSLLTPYVWAVVVAAITSNLGLTDMPGNVRLTSRDSGLSKASVVNVTQLATIRRERLTDCVRALPPQVISHIDEGVKLVLGL